MSKPSQRSEKVPPGAVPRAEIPRLEDWNELCRLTRPATLTTGSVTPRARDDRRHAKSAQLQLPFE
jgi:hypothetical protein